MLNATTIDLGETRSWTNDEAREARRLELGEEALELHAEILELVERERQGKYGICVRLGRMSHEALWKHFGLYGSFEDYAVKSGAATSCRTTTRASGAGRGPATTRSTSSCSARPTTPRATRAG